MVIGLSPFNKYTSFNCSHYMIQVSLTSVDLVLVSLVEAKQYECEICMQMNEK